MIRLILSIVLALLVTAPLNGCASHWPEVNAKLEAPQQVYRVAPKQLAQIVTEVVSAPPLSIGVTEAKDGSLLTGYQSFPGEFHVARRWQERTRYRITIIPDWNEPTAAARVEVREMSEQRAAEGMQWHPAPEVQRPERAEQMLKTLDEKIRTRVPAAK